MFIPTLYRNEYIAGLKRLKSHKDPDPFIRVTGFAQRLVAAIDVDDLHRTRRILERCNAFHDPADDVRLRLPAEAAPL